MILSELKLRTVAEYRSEPEARVIECVLAMEGIPCLLKNAETVEFLHADGNAIAGVTVQVAECNWDAAQAVLTPQHRGEAAWICSACGTDVDAEFDTCWQCGVERGSAVKSPVVSIPQAEPDLPDETPDSQHLRRVWWGSVIGFFAASQLVMLAGSSFVASSIGWYLAWGLFNAYSLWLCRIHYQGLATTNRVKFQVALALNLLSIVVWLFAVALSGVL